jgi:hypothetical protein
MRKKAYLQQKFKLSPKAFWNTIKDFNIKIKNSDSVKFSIEELNSINKAFLDKPASLQPGNYNLIKNQCESHNFPHTDNIVYYITRHESDTLQTRRLVEEYEDAKASEYFFKPSSQA